MDLLLTIASTDDRDLLERALVDAASAVIDEGGARGAVVNTRVGGAEWDELGGRDNEADAAAMVKLSDVGDVDVAAKFPVPVGASLVGVYASEEIVQKDAEYEPTWPAGAPSPGVKLVCFVRRKPSLTHEEYLAHWRDRHGPLAVRVQPGFWHYVQNHVVDWRTPETPDFDGIGELHFRTADDLRAGMFADDDARRLIYEDIDRFMVPETSTVLVTREVLVGEEGRRSTA